jgi:hypothetical protein
MSDPLIGIVQPLDHRGSEDAEIISATRAFLSSRPNAHICREARGLRLLRSSSDFADVSAL